ncbi:hypothetical protein PCL_03740 [Purpureocillium lilacinum]|uniref:Uncharacterized protein n=1 Tax=Purpureocillium lilacinum TaxID=33203 RepID=A0A2U3EPW0_PURLI|nr:hypothetical protein PCL_03740 [Purpureocillium lilacinum]
MFHLSDLGRKAASESSTAASTREPPSDLLYETSPERSTTPRPTTRRIFPYDFMTENPMFQTVIENMQDDSRAEVASTRSRATIRDRDNTSDMVSSSEAAGPSAFHKQCLVALKLLHELKDDLEMRRGDAERRRDEYASALRRRDWLDFRRDPVHFLTITLGIKEPKDLLDRMAWFSKQGGRGLRDSQSEARLQAQIDWDCSMPDLSRVNIVCRKQELSDKARILASQIEHVDHLIMSASSALAEDGEEVDGDDDDSSLGFGGMDEELESLGSSQKQDRSSHSDASSQEREEEEEEEKKMKKKNKGKQPWYNDVVLDTDRPSRESDRASPLLRLSSPSDLETRSEDETSHQDFELSFPPATSASEAYYQAMLRARYNARAPRTQHTTTTVNNTAPSPDARSPRDGYPNFELEDLVDAMIGTTVDSMLERISREEAVDILQGAMMKAAEFHAQEVLENESRQRAREGSR